MQTIKTIGLDIAKSVFQVHVEIASPHWTLSPGYPSVGSTTLIDDRVATEPTHLIEEARSIRIAAPTWLRTRPLMPGE